MASQSTEGVLEIALKLNVRERFELVELLWNSIADAGVNYPISATERAMLDERLADCIAHPDDEEPWSKVREDILGK
jgi:putative addiction module component (TIGR02574 family)